MKRTGLLYSLAIILLLVLAAEMAGLFPEHEPSGHRQNPAATVVPMNHITSVSIRDVDDHVLITVDYILEDRHREKAGIRVKAQDRDTGKMILEGFAGDGGTGSVEIVLRREPHLHYPVNIEQLRIELISADRKLLANLKVRRPIKWSSWKIDGIGNAPPADPYQVSGQLHRLFGKRDFQSLDALCEQWRDGQSRTLDGRWQLEGFKYMLDYGEENGRRERNAGILRDWRKYNEDSSCAAIMEAESWIIHSRELPGYGARNRDGKPAAGAFRKSLEQAERILLDTKEYAADNPLWYERYIYILNQLGRNLQEIMPVFIEAVEKEKYYYPLYTTTAVAMMPRWAGAYRLVERFADDAVKYTQDREGDTLYTRIYVAVDNNILTEGRLFKDARVSWPRMKQGFEDIIRNYPDSDYNLNQFASFACQAGDADKYLKLRNQVKAGLNTSSLWNSNYSLDVCDHMFMQRL